MSLNNKVYSFVESKQKKNICCTLHNIFVIKYVSTPFLDTGHFYDMNVLAYSPDGQLIATGGDDGKVKIWNTRSGFCFVTFNEHAGGVYMRTWFCASQPFCNILIVWTLSYWFIDMHATFGSPFEGITGLRFSHTGHAVYSSSLDGTVRAYDLIRYRNFRTFTSPSPTQFSCVCVSPFFVQIYPCSCYNVLTDWITFLFVFLNSLP